MVKVIPWLNNLEELALQLESDEQLPHQMYELILDDGIRITLQNPRKVGEYYRSTNGITQGTISIVTNVITCIICSEMHDRRQAYKLEKAKLLLSEEALIVIPTTDDQACVMLTALAQMKCQICNDELIDLQGDDEPEPSWHHSFGTGKHNHPAVPQENPSNDSTTSQ